ncbi:putative aldouronate transport system substrate-binding protein [Paenibacillus sp. 1_12]|uniref:extracellular solute-binding protein n=1 Tax=Paenibacillus sp. 1_12 TaxID=1566278 RepID=UPI0008F04E09|nr:extracellular solute-binding protein [Paenibacillus sp. 1_12]SFM30053.1 putative aldouronate transport system substrate-binding protein [Paenibacillus sp. 1_12]
MFTGKSAKTAQAVLSITLVLSVISGCVPGSNKEGKSTKAKDAETAAKLTSLTYWAALNPAAAATMKSYNEMEAYKEMERITGVKVDFQHPPQGGTAEKEQFNLMLTSGTLPDVIEYNWNGYPGGPEKAIKDNRIVKLNDYIDKYAPNYKKVLDSNPEWKKQVTTDDGSIVGFHFIRGDRSLQIFRGAIIREDWLNKLGLKKPTTIDEWYTVLKAFKEKDPNGNGKADEVPLLLSLSELKNTQAFVGAYGVSSGFYKEGNTVKYGPIEQGYKEFLTTMNKWYKEGLIDRDFAATDTKLLDAKVTGNQLGAIVGAAGGALGKYMNLMASKDKTFKLSGVPYPVLKAGDKPQFGHFDQPVPGKSAAITTSNKNIVETIKWLDMGYSEQGHMLFNFGKEGVSYKLENGYPKYTDTITNNPDGLPMSQAIAKHNRASWDGIMVQDKRYSDQYQSQVPEQLEAIDIWSTPINEKVMPPVTPNKDESGKYASVMTDINTYKDEMYNKFIMGAEPIENFDKYVKTLKGMGIDDAINIQQAALERYNKR